MKHQTPPTAEEIGKGWEAYREKGYDEIDELLIPEIHNRIQKNEFLTPLDLFAIVCWKIRKMKPAEEALVKNGEIRIKQVTEEAFRELKAGNVEQAMNTLLGLHQVAPRLASAIFTFYDPQKYGTMDVHAFHSLGWPNYESDFSPDTYRKYLSKLESYKTKLNSSLSCHQIDASLFMLDK